jgi:hypothetical protein
MFIKVPQASVKNGSGKMKVQTVHVRTSAKKLTDKMRAAIVKQWPEIVRIVSGAPIGDNVFNVVVHYDDQYKSEEK